MALSPAALLLLLCKPSSSGKIDVGVVSLGRLRMGSGGARMTRLGESLAVSPDESKLNFRAGIGILRLGSPFFGIGVVGDSSTSLEAEGKGSLVTRLSIAGGSIGNSFSTDAAPAPSSEMWDSAVTKEDPEEETNDAMDGLAEGPARFE